MNNVYEIQLAREILQIKDVKSTLYFSIWSRDKEFFYFKDDYIKVEAAKNTKALCVTIYHPLTSARSNPVIMVDDEGKVYRTHGEVSAFNLYAEKLLGKEQKTFFNEWAKDKEIEILNLLS